MRHFKPTIFYFFAFCFLIGLLNNSASAQSNKSISPPNIPIIQPELKVIGGEANTVVTTSKPVTKVQSAPYGLVKGEKSFHISEVPKTIPSDILKSFQKSKADQIPKLTSHLDKLFKLCATDKKAWQAEAEQHGFEVREDKVLVTILPLLGKTTADINKSHLENLDITIQATSNYSFDAWIPVDELENAANMAGIGSIRKIIRPHFDAITSEGVGLMGADNWQQLGHTGTGVKVAVIDGGFERLTAAQNNGDVPVNYIAQDFSGLGMETNGVHGTAVAEAIYDIVPNAEFHLCKTNSFTEWVNAVQYCIDNNIDIVNYSATWFANSYYDGTGIVSDIVNIAINSGIIWVNSAGNSAQTHYRSNFVGAANNFHDFGDGATLNFLNIDNDDVIQAIPFGSSIRVILNWNAYPTTSEDYDLLLVVYDGVNFSVVDISETRQVNTDPVEYIEFVNPYSGVAFGVAVVKYNATSNADFTLESLTHNFQYRTAASSIADPGVVEEVITVGAIDRLNYFSGPQEPFSSQGPTNDGRMKPNIAAPDNCQSFAYDGAWNGTSLAAPHVAGIVAQIKSRFPSYTNAQIKDYLYNDCTFDLGEVGEDNIFGMGALQLPQLDDPNINCTTDPSWVTVTNGDDSGPGSLRQAIIDVASGGTINFDGVTTVNLSSGHIVVNKSLTIEGCENVTIQAINSQRLFYFDGGYTVNINNITMQNGEALYPTYSGVYDSGGAFWVRSGMVLNLTDCVLRNNKAGTHGGGAITSYFATVNFVNCQLLNNSSTSQAGFMLNQDSEANFTNCLISGNISNSPSHQGGAIASFSAHSNNTALTLTDCIVENNQSSGIGGGISVSNNGAGKISALEMNNCIVRNNTAGNGGGLVIVNEGASSILNNVEIHNNTAGLGAGVLTLFKNATTTMTDCYVHHNTADFFGGGVYVLRENAQLTMDRCIVSHNRSNRHGGGVANYGATADLTNCLIDFNIADDDDIIEVVDSIGWGGGIMSMAYVNTTDNVEDPADLSLMNCTVAFNRGDHNNGILVADWEDVQSCMTTQNTIIYNPTGTGTDYSNCGTSPCITSTGSNMVGDLTLSSELTQPTDRHNISPYFKHVDINNPENNDFSLRACSYAVDNGTMTNAPSIDILSENRDAMVDIGVYEAIGEDCGDNPFSFSDPEEKCSSLITGYVTVEGMEASAGDWIAAIDAQGNIVGAQALFVGPSNCGNHAFFYMNIYGDLSFTAEDEGLIDGETFTLEIYDASDNAYLIFEGLNGTDWLTWTANCPTDANATPPIPELLPDYSDFCAPFNFIDGRRDELFLEAGWNLVSFDVAPNFNSLTYLQERLDPDNLQYAAAFLGDEGYVTYDPSLPPFFSHLNQFNDQQGYWIKLNEPDVILVNGLNSNFNSLEQLDAGWNLVSYTPDAAQTPEAFFSDLINTSNLEYACGFNNGEYECYDPALPPFFNSLTSIDNGFGYWVKVAEGVGTPDNNIVNPPFDFTPTRDAGSLVGIVTANNAPVTAGSWVAAFDSQGNCAGANEITIHAGQSYINLSIYGDDNDTAEDEGMNNSEDFTLKLYDAASDQYYDYGTNLSNWSNTNAAVMSDYNNPDEVYNFAVALPIQLVQFDAQIKNKAVVLNWTSASEIDLSHFEIERSSDSKKWKFVEKVLAIGSNNNTIRYETIDDLPLSGTSYYRLKIVENSGDLEYSGIRTVDFKSSSQSPVQVYPNPTKGDLMITIPEHQSIQQIEIYNALGLKVQTILSNQFINTGQEEVDLSRLGTGIYLLNIQIGEQHYLETVIVD